MALKSFTFVRVGPVIKRSPSFSKHGIGIVVGEMRLEIDPERRCARQRIRQEERAGIVLAAIDAVGVCSKRSYPCLPVKRQTEA